MKGKGNYAQLKFTSDVRKNTILQIERAERQTKVDPLAVPGADLYAAAATAEKAALHGPRVAYATEGERQAFMHRCDDVAANEVPPFPGPGQREASGDPVAQTTVTGITRADTAAQLIMDNQGLRRGIKVQGREIVANIPTSLTPLSKEGADNAILKQSVSLHSVGRQPPQGAPNSPQMTSVPRKIDNEKWGEVVDLINDDSIISQYKLSPAGKCRECAYRISKILYDNHIPHSATGVLVWSGVSNLNPTNHYAISANFGDAEMVIDPSFGQFGSMTPFYGEKEKWIENLKDAFKNKLIISKEYADISLAEREIYGLFFAAPSDFNGNIIQSTRWHDRILKNPAAYAAYERKILGEGARNVASKSLIGKLASTVAKYRIVKSQDDKPQTKSISSDWTANDQSTRASAQKGSGNVERSALNNTVNLYGMEAADAKREMGATDIHALASQIRQMGSWDNAAGDLVPALLTDSPLWPRGRALMMVNEQTGQEYTLKDPEQGVPHREPVRIMRVNENHYVAMQGNTRLDVPSDGDCFYHAVLKALGTDIRPLMRQLGFQGGSDESQVIQALRRYLANRLETHARRYEPMVELIRIAETGPQPP
ncbi:hypothetical protein ACV22V_32240, partial [Burkholderia sp. AW33-5]